MGTCLTTLHFYGLAREALEPRLEVRDLLRDQNTPWLSIVPPYGAEHNNYARLEKLAKCATKEYAGASALLFDYFDDDEFRCVLYQGGKRSASCQSGGSWAKLGKQLNVLFGDDLPARAFRYASRCYNLEDQVRLLEEAVGAALFDVQEEEPRVVQRCDEMLQTIKYREEALRKRPNQYKLTELAEEDWPLELRARQGLFRLLRPQWARVELNWLIYQTDMKRYMVPGSPGLIAYPYRDEIVDEHRLFLYDIRSGEHWDLGPFMGLVCRVLRKTKQGDLVLLLDEKRPGTQNEYGHGIICCMGVDGEERWRFQPEMGQYHHLSYVDEAGSQVITLYAGANVSVRSDGLIWRIDGETGKLLCSRRIPIDSDEMIELYHVEALDCFLYAERNRKELVFLNHDLEETKRWNGFFAGYYLKDSIVGNMAWYLDYPNERVLHLFDLRDGTEKTVTMEIPVLVEEVLPDGRILGTAGKGNTLFVLDQNGIVAARCRVPGMLNHILTDGDSVLVTEVRAPDTDVFYGALFDQVSIHVWKLEAK